MFVPKGSLFLGRISQLSDGLSIGGKPKGKEFGQLQEEHRDNRETLTVGDPSHAGSLTGVSLGSLRITFSNQRLWEGFLHMFMRGMQGLRA